MSYAKSAVAKNTLIQTIGKGLSTILGLATFAILWRVLGPTDYGTLTIALTFLAVFATFVDFGLTLTTVQLISEHADREKEILNNLLSLRLISAGVFLGAAPIISLFFPYTTTVQILIAVGVLSYYSASISQMLVGIFQKNLDMRKPMIAENLNRVLVLFGIISIGLFHGSLQAVMWVFVLGNITQLATILWFTKKYAVLKPQISWSIWKLIIGRSWPIGMSIFFNLIYLKGDIFFLSLYRDAHEVGLYGMAYKIIEVIASIPVMYMGLVLPILVGAWAAKEREKFGSALQDAFDFFTVIGFPMAFGLALVARELITFVGGEEFTQAGPVLYILGPALLCVFYGALFGHAIVGINKQKQMTLVYAIVAILTVAGYMWSIPTYGMYGAATWTFISEGLIALLTAAVVLYVSRVRLQFGLFVKVVASTIAMAAAVIYIPSPHVLISIVFGAIAYIASLTGLGGPTIKELRTLLLHS